jgi:hypothetical protein
MYNVWVMVYLVIIGIKMIINLQLGEPQPCGKKSQLKGLGSETEFKFFDKNE